MFAQYSKFVLIATVATSCFMMSCQKAGERGVKATTANATNTKQEPAKKVDGKTGTDESVPVGKIDVPTPKPTATPAPKEKEKEEAAPTGETKKEEDKKIEVKKEETKKEEVKKVETKVEDKVEDKLETKACTDEMKSSAMKIATTKSSIKTEDSEEQQIKKLSAGIASCEKVEKLLADAKIDACSVKIEQKPRLLSVKATQEACNEIGVDLKILDGKDNKYAEAYNVARLKTLKADKLVVSDEAKEMFSDNSLDFKKYLINGELKSDSAELQKSYDEKKVACAITQMGELRFNLDTSMALKINRVVDLLSREPQDFQNGISMYADLELGSKSDENEKITKKSVVLSCLNININKLDVVAVRTALGKHIAVEEKKVEVKKADVKK